MTDGCEAWTFNPEAVEMLFLRSNASNIVSCLERVTNAFIHAESHFIHDIVWSVCFTAGPRRLEGNERHI